MKVHLLEQQFLHLWLQDFTNLKIGLGQGINTWQTPRFKFMTPDPWITWSIAKGSYSGLWCLIESHGVSRSLMTQEQGVNLKLIWHSQFWQESGYVRLSSIWGGRFLLTFSWALRPPLFSSLWQRYLITILLPFLCNTHTKDLQEYKWILRVLWSFCHHQSAKVIYSPAGGSCFLFLLACSSIFRFSFAFPAGLPLPLLLSLVVVFGCGSVLTTFSSFSSALRPPRFPRGGIIRTDQSANVPGKWAGDTTPVRGRRG